MEKQSSKGEVLLDHVLRRALDKGEGTAKTTLDGIARGESCETVNTLVQERLLQRGVGSQVFFPSLQAMLRKGEDFDTSIAPLQSVIRLGITILEDEDRADKTATFGEVVSALLEQFPKLADPLVQRRFGWALFGLEPFISVFNAVHPLESRSLSFRPSLLDGIKTLEDVLAAQDRHRLEEDEKKVLRTYADAFAQTERRHSTPIMLGEDVRQDVVLHSLISKDEAELTETKRVIVTEKGLRRGQQVVAGFTADRPQLQKTQEDPAQKHPFDRMADKGENWYRRVTKNPLVIVGTILFAVIVGINQLRISLKDMFTTPPKVSVENRCGIHEFRLPTSMLNTGEGPIFECEGTRFTATGTTVQTPEGKVLRRVTLRAESKHSGVSQTCTWNCSEGTSSTMFQGGCTLPAHPLLDCSRPDEAVLTWTLTPL